VPATRIAFADTNWLFSLYYQTRDTVHVLEWAEQPSTLVLSGPVLAECSCLFWRAGDRLVELEADIRSKRLIETGYSFESLVEEAKPLWRRYTSRFPISTLDMLHVIAARRFGCSWFLSFDSQSGCRALASVLGLKVFPPLTTADREIVSKLRH
jgi:predicted nucleic acid-binding protein